MALSIIGGSMLSVVNTDSTITLEHEKQIILNRVIAAGINSLSGYINNNTNDPNKMLLDSFISQSFDKVLAVWPMLDERIKFHIFKANIVDFENYMKDKVGQNV